MVASRYIASVDSFVSCDPGVQRCWFAVFDCGLFARNCWGSPYSEAPPAPSVVVELPRVYSAGQQKGDQNDLIALAFSAGRVSAQYRDATTVYPRDWKGTLDAEVMIERIKERLSDEERSRVQLPSAKSLHHNVWDSIGIGLWKLGRLQPKRNYHR